ncbi:TIGR01459 family HAD-type hydrolase [Aestuariibius sp. 2305UL40-4]|uniref:TIGR01459 family HAD-type hydrolase n=1 Tax=Aestuariibius violaceus TaxID=3234132 RepID=UPI00345E989C
MTQIIESFSEVSGRYDAAFVDLWGCMHNGIEAHATAVDAMRKYRENGGTVVFVTNAPRPWRSVEKQLDRLGVPKDTWDAIATSGDSARAAMFRGAVGNKVWFMGESHDEAFFEPPEIVDDPAPIARVDLKDADGIVCCGPFDPHADPEVNRPDFLYAKTKGLKLLCANPDIVVDRGETREWCAGALAKLYTEMGGESLYFGKPHPPIYDLARRRLVALGKDLPNEGIVAIGDGIHTDISGARGEDIDSVFISGGLAADLTKTSHNPDAEALNAYIEKENVDPTFTMGQLR